MKKNKKLYLCIVLALVLCASCAISILILKNKSHVHEFINGVCNQCGEKQSSVLDDQGSPLDSNEIVLMPSKLTFTRSMDTEKQITVQATIDPAEATNQNVTWSISFLDPSNEWIQNRSVEEFMKINPDGLCVSLQCIQPFAEEIILKCRSDSNPNISAECVLNYLQRVNLNWIYFDVKNETVYEADGSLELSFPIGKNACPMTAGVFMGYDDYTEMSEFETTFQLLIADEFLSYLEQKNLKPTKTSYDFKVGEEINFTITSIIQMFGLSPDQMGNRYNENQISNIFHGYNGFHEPTFNIVAHTVNKKDATNELTTTFMITPDVWSFDVEVHGLTLNTTELQF